MQDPLDTPLSEDSPAVDSLDDLYAEARQAERKIRRPRNSSPEKDIHDEVNAAAKRLRETYTNPDNWKRGRGLVLTDKETHTVLGNFIEYLHKTGARKLIRAHEPIEIQGQEEVEGWLGHQRSAELRGVSFDSRRRLTCHITLDELAVDCPNVEVEVFLLLGTIVRAELATDTQFACASGNVLLQFKAGTNLWEACGVDTKAALRKGVL